MKKFNITKRRSTLFVACLVASAGLTTTVQAADFPEAGNFTEGSKIWSENCNRCHNMRGPKELRDDQWISTSYHMRIRAGLTGQETRDVVTFLQGSNTKAVKPTSTAIVSVPTTAGQSGKNIYNGTCTSCHDTDGTGAFPGTPDFTSSDGALTKSDSVLIDHITNGFQSEGSPMAMPPKGGNPNLSDEGVKAVLAYIREMFGQ